MIVGRVPTISESELFNASDEILRRAEAGETFTVTISGRPVAQIGPITPGTWIATDQLTPIWQNVAPSGLLEDMAQLDETVSVLGDPDALTDIREADAAYAEGDVLRGAEAARDLRR